MIFDYWLALSIVGGAVAGFGLFLLAIQFVPATPALGPALKRLHPNAAPTAASVTAERLPAPSRWPATDLAILARTPERHTMTIAVAAASGFVLPLVLALCALILGIQLPFTIPVAVSVALAALLGYHAHHSMRSNAKAARREFVQALAVYTALTAHQVRSGHGAVEAMERSAAICTGWPYQRLRSALLTAQLQMRPPWDELKSMAAAIDVVELASFADIMRSAGADGAQVYSTLRAQASSLRDQLRVKTLEAAKTRTSKLDIPSTLLIMIILVLIGYPLVISVFSVR
ncbi:type II secretion system F family protein [Catelliglobosispora koreensis]|uniref:type II secretion system F family protein n=1 Tax=Catelliglobosispora koreensis TaxID=129052 RepID=UPI00036749AA|nr:type II secretion system F family protein [Catelliglobosispora koreensis]